jgi:DNA-binding response OmpR family regulator
MPKVLLADDDPELLQSVSAWLQHHKYNVDMASDGAEAREYMSQIEYDVLVIDWTMPSVSGIELCQWFRARGGTTPILILTGKDEISDKEKGLDSGADDYLTKPFDLRELTARLNALMRRGKVLATRVLQVGPLTIDPDAHRVMVDGNEMKLTATEFAVLEFMGRHPDQVFSADALIARVWKTSSEISTDTVRVYVKRLREKFEAAGYPGLLTNVHGVGYKIVPTQPKKSAE